MELYISHDDWMSYTIRPNEPGYSQLEPIKIPKYYFEVLRPDIPELPLGGLGIVINKQKKKNKRKNEDGDGAD